MGVAGVLASLQGALSFCFMVPHNFNINANLYFYYFRIIDLQIHLPSNHKQYYSLIFTTSYILPSFFPLLKVNLYVFYVPGRVRQLDLIGSFVFEYKLDADVKEKKPSPYTYTNQLVYSIRIRHIRVPVRRLPNTQKTHKSLFIIFLTYTSA